MYGKIKHLTILIVIFATHNPLKIVKTKYLNRKYYFPLLL